MNSALDFSNLAQAERVCAPMRYQSMGTDALNKAVWVFLPASAQPPSLGASQLADLSSGAGRQRLGLCAWPLQRVKRAPVALKHRKGPVVGPQAQHPLAGMVHHAGGLEHQLLYHRADATALRAVAHRCIGPVQRVLANQAQQVHRHGRQRAHHVVGVELARGQPGQIHVGFELRVKLLMRAVLGVQGNDLLGRERLRQGGAPAFQHILGQQHLLAPFVNGALGQAVHAACFEALVTVSDGHALLPQALAFTGAQYRPSGVGIGYPCLGDGLYRRAARVPLDEPRDLALQGFGLSGDGTHQLGRIKARVGPQQQGRLGRCRDFGRQRQQPLDVVFGLAGRVLGARAQGKLQAKALGAQVGHQRAVAVHSRIGAPHMLLGRAALVHGEGVDVQWHISTGQRPEVDGLALELEAQNRGVDVIDQVKPSWRVGVQALAQGGRRGHRSQAQGAGEESVLALAFDGIKIVLAQTQQAQVALEDVAIGDAAAHGVSGVDQGVEIDALEVLANQGQASVLAQVVGQLFDDKIGHGGFTFRVKHTWGSR